MTLDPQLDPWVANALTSHVNQREHRLRPLPYNPPSPLFYCASCLRVERAVNGVTQPMGVCWPRVGSRVLLVVLALSLAVAITLYLGEH